MRFSYQFQHPGAGSACGEAAKGSQEDDDGPGADEDVGHVGGILVENGEVDFKADLSPNAHRKQDDAGDLWTQEGDTEKAVDWWTSIYGSGRSHLHARQTLGSPTDEVQIIYSIISKQAKPIVTFRGTPSNRFACRPLKAKATYGSCPT